MIPEPRILEERERRAYLEVMSALSRARRELEKAISAIATYQELGTGYSHEIAGYGRAAAMIRDVLAACRQSL